MSKYLQKKQHLETDMYAVPSLTPKKHLVSKSMDSDEQSDSVCYLIFNSFTNFSCIY